ncbi:hypothetical protein R2R35_13985 [Anaerocolumna sp. AGMB13020]|uniref:hypothetical protein n=1 Tax=Anaerocolumna sp. AGMB13020 TaxID=3081750 RepID=UPI002953259D|nr:hypothetical protein [Anaerocolumna sp. AGMB13020]WOO34908.1 hypothetical protein R2R35_13985 [Anaerocolumna sp. AGMB13020]
MKIKIIALSLLLALSTMFTPLAVKAEVRVPDSISHNGLLPDGTSVDSQPNYVTPFFLIETQYVSGAALYNKSIIYKHKYIYGTSVSYVKGASPTYTLSVSKEATSSHEFSVSGSAKFNVKVVEAEVKGGYKYTDTTKITKGESWQCGFSAPGLYNLSWYQRAHQYEVHGKCKYITTDADNGTIKLAYMGRITFPTSEVHFEVTK